MLPQGDESGGEAHVADSTVDAAMQAVFTPPDHAADSRNADGGFASAAPYPAEALASDPAEALASDPEEALASAVVDCAQLQLEQASAERSVPTTSRSVGRSIVARARMHGYSA
jgi:hypothetical protein